MVSLKALGDKIMPSVIQLLIVLGGPLIVTQVMSASVFICLSSCSEAVLNPPNVAIL